MLLDFLLPAQCVVCGKLPKPICYSCIPSQQALRGEFAGLPLFYVGELEGDLEKIITSYKDSHRVSLEPVLTELLNRAVGQMQKNLEFNFFCLPPRNSRNYRRRGFHPIERLTGRSRLNMVPRVFAQPTRKLLDQRTLAAKERLGNTNMAFSIKSGQGKLVLVDDVLTTGATLAELKRAATEAGYRVIAICVIARR